MPSIGRYEILATLGEGGMGTVYRALDTRLERVVALKVIRLSQLLDPQQRQQFSQRFAIEARATARLHHPNIVAVHDFAEEDGLAYLVMELVEGRSLQSKMAGPIPLEETLRILKDCAAALDHAHAQGVIHRDVTPSNLLVRDSDGAAKLTDFGIARIQQDTGLTSTGVVMGKPHYLSPESVKQTRQPIDGRSDQFSLGVVAYELLTGRKPFNADSAIALAFQIVTGEIPTVGMSDRVLTERLDSVFRRVLAKEPNDRFPSCAAFVEELARVYRARQPVATGPPQLPMPKQIGGFEILGVIGGGESQQHKAEAERQARWRAEAEQRARDKASAEWKARAEQESRAEQNRLARAAGDAQSNAGPERGALNVFLALLALAVLDQVLRAGLSLATPRIAGDLHISFAEISSVLSALTFGYAVCAPFAGMAVSRFGTRSVVGIGLLLSAVAAAWSALATDVPSMIAARALMGCGLSTVAPVYCAIFAGYDERRRVLANAVFEFVSRMTAFALSVVSGAVIATIGWRPYIGLGAGAAAILTAWMLANRSVAPGLRIGPSGRSLRTRTALGCFAAYFGYSYCLQQVLVWILQLYREAGLVVEFSSVMTLVIGTSAMVSAGLSAGLIASNRATAWNMSKRFVIGGLMLAALTIGIATNRNPLSYIFATGSCIALGAVGPSLWTLVQSAAPTGAAAKWGGFQALAGSLGVILSSLMTARFGLEGVGLSVVVALAAALAAAVLISANKPIPEASGAW